MTSYFSASGVCTVGKPKNLETILVMAILSGNMSGTITIDENDR